MDRKELNKNITSDIFNAVNMMGNWHDLAETISEHIETEHRTLVQNFFRCIAQVIENYSKHIYFDARNEGSLDWAKEVAKIEYYMPHI